MMFSWIFLIILIGFAIWYFGNGGNGNFLAGNKKEDAIDILKKKYASGEISKEEYEERKAVLKKDNTI